MTASDAAKQQIDKLTREKASLESSQTDFASRIQVIDAQVAALKPLVVETAPATTEAPKTPAS